MTISAWWTANQELQLIFFININEALKNTIKKGYEVNTIYNEFVKLRNMQERLASNYEEKKCYEMAYLSRWYVLEKILKVIANLKDTDRVPQVRTIEGYLNYELSTIKEIMNTNQKNGTRKWRKKRNDLAHGAAPFGSKVTYDEYNDKILEGIEELERALIDKCS